MKVTFLCASYQAAMLQASSLLPSAAATASSSALDASSSSAAIVLPGLSQRVTAGCSAGCRRLQLSSWLSQRCFWMRADGRCDLCGWKQWLLVRLTRVSPVQAAQRRPLPAGLAALLASVSQLPLAQGSNKPAGIALMVFQSGHFPVGRKAGA